VSCPPASSYARYLAGELSREESRPVETHLVQCRRCRELVLALRERGGAPDAPGQSGASTPGDPDGGPLQASRRSRALALPLTLVALAGVVATAMALLETGLPPPFTGTDPPDEGWRRSYAMAIDLVFVLRESAPVLFDLALPVAAMASASALLSFGLSTLRRRIGGPGAKVLAALVILATPGDGRAHFGMHEHEELVVAAGSVHSGTLVASARTVTVDGVVDGDLVVLTERLVLRGEVSGNLFAVAREADLRGVVNGSVFLGGERSTFGGEVRGDVYAGGESFALAPDGRIARDLTVAADQVLLEGELGRDANAIFAGSIEARGAIGRDLRGHASRLVLLESARVGANVEVSLPVGVAIERSPAAEVGGELRALEHESQEGSELDRFLEPELYAWMLLHLGAAFVLGMLLHRLAPGILAVRADSPRDLLRGLWIGVATLVVVPLGLVLAAATVVGIPVALLGAAALGAALYVGLVALGGLIGAALLHPAERGGGGFGTALAAGLALLVLLTHLPFLGGALRVVAIVVGLGLLVEHGLERWRNRELPAAS
jgi:hypothetical protein